ncbi:uncharacterized protein GGS25DRAFT_533273 [Hypoxylon fragiforme]|uniref:uncharacterized protein n=1 Tax=Hypoxylon fragiforme TaxID=63214 RepID=UPI0020C5BCD5|nr:uncharacterized protein GGS25DRAFT_533273 [Hypoxylon fragiforme]KAI2606158.1 hypothetical protein GGS25DRAFT_533273 [Hypoxylon fragiforme]
MSPLILPLLLTLLKLLAAITALYTVHLILAFLHPYLYPRISGAEALSLNRYLHATKGKPAWAFVSHVATSPSHSHSELENEHGEGTIGQALAFELASRGFNVVLHGSDLGALRAVRDALLRRYPDGRYRVVVAASTDTTSVSAAADRDGDGDGDGGADAFVRRVVSSLEDVNLTVLLVTAAATTTTKISDSDDGHDNTTTTSTPAPTLTAALSPLLARNAPALIIHLSSLPSPPSPSPSTTPTHSVIKTPTSNITTLHYKLLPLPLPIPIPKPRQQEQSPSLLHPPPSVLARAILARAGCHDGDEGEGKGSNVVYPYLPHAVVQKLRGVLPVWVVDWVVGDMYSTAMQF